MNDLIDSDRVKYPICVSIRFSNGDVLIQPLDADSEGAQDFMNWFRNPKEVPVFTWSTPCEQRIKLVHKSQITCVEIDGYIEPNDGVSKWYHRMFDKLRVWMIARRAYGKNITHTKRDHTEDERGLLKGNGCALLPPERRS